MELKTKLETTTKNHQASIQILEAKFDRLADKQSARPSRSLPSNTQPNPQDNPSKPYQPPQARNEHVNVIFTRSGKSHDPPTNLHNLQNDFENPINFDSDDEDEESTPTTKLQTLKPIKETPIPKPYKPKIPYPQRLRKEKMEAFGKFLDMIRVIRIIVPLVDLTIEMPNYGKNLKNFIDAIDEILEEDFDALLDEGSKILYSIEGTLLEEKIFAEFDKFMAMNIKENSEPHSDKEEIPFEKITFDTNYKIKKSLDEPPTDLDLKLLPDHLKYAFL
nr:reverse transcriptase domain-containing protein [Tanacetum cinerariifolium]